jgi:integrase
MSDLVHDLLVSRRNIAPGEFVFPGVGRPGHVGGAGFGLKQVAAATGIQVSCHDLRRTYLTIAESTDISVMALKALVNHALGGDVTSGYVQITTERLREPAERVCGRMTELCGIAAAEGVRRLP